jgi:putative hydrolase of the HAD superfamily
VSLLLPKAVVLDLDDTILDDSSNVDAAWMAACEECRHDWLDLDREQFIATLFRVRDWFWSDKDRHRTGRHDLRSARVEIVRLALAELGLERLSLATAIGERYTALRESGISALPGAIETVRWLRQAPCTLVLLTNGSAAAQRRKIDRFNLGELFDHILIEGEMGFGKPDPRAFHRALEAANVEPADAWMAGDNLEWDIEVPRQLGMHTIWVDRHANGLPEGSPIRPHRVVRYVSELMTEWRG